MGNSRIQFSPNQNNPELPYLFQYISSNAVAGFDSSQDNTPVANALPDIDMPSATTCLPVSSVQGIESGRSHCVSISMLPSKRVSINDQGEEVNFSKRTTDNSGCSPAVECQKANQVKFYSQPMPSGASSIEAVKENLDQQKNMRINKLKDKRFDSFKTWPGKLESQFSNLVGKPQETTQEPSVPQAPPNEALPVDRYFDALEGPELETLRASEELVLPKDKKWPFLLRFPISAFGICLGISSQAILWKTLATSASTEFLHINPSINYVLWCIAVAVAGIVSVIYSLKIILYFEAVRREYYHPIRINFFFAPWVAFLFLVLGLPTQISNTVPQFLWYVLMTPILALELKIYGQWMSGGRRRLSKVANPSNHLSIVGNFVGALLGAAMGLKEGPLFFFAVGMAHYTVLFVTLYQRLPTNETLPKELHPVFFLFVAPPSVASMAWARLQGSFGYGSRIAYFVALFLYVSLAVRANFFRGFRFSLAWWAYTFPMTGAAIATIRYANEVQHPITSFMSVSLSVISTLTVSALLVSTLLHAFVLRDLFPNDIAIAISHRRPKGSRRRSHQRCVSADIKDVEAAVDAVAQKF